MYESCLEKQEKLKNLFTNFKDSNEKYHKIIDLGRQLPKMDISYKTEANLVKGCQSVMYLRGFLENDKVFFEADSDALISLGLCALLISIYSNESAETILKCPPNCLEELGISSSLSQNRANGLYSIHLKMKQEALRLLTSV